MTRLSQKREEESGGLPIIDTGAIALAPAAGSVPDGVIYYDNVTGKAYISRYVGNYVNNSTTSATDSVTVGTVFNPNNDFCLSIGFRQDIGIIGFTGLFCQRGTSTIQSERGLWIERFNLENYYIVSLSNNAGSVKQFTTAAIVDGLWHTLKVMRVGDAFSINVDGVSSSSIDLTGFTVNVPISTSIGSQDVGTRAINGNIASVKVACAASGSFAYDFNQDSGSTIIDVSGNGNNGTVIDANPTTFWSKAWVPTSILS